MIFGFGLAAVGGFLLTAVPNWTGAAPARHGFVTLAAGLWLLGRVAGRSWHRERSIAPLVWYAPVIWVGLEYTKSMAFSGFPWMDLGYGLFSQPTLIQAADLGGHYLLSFALVLGNALFVALIDRQRRAVRWNIRFERRLLIAAMGFAGAGAQKRSAQ